MRRTITPTKIENRSHLGFHDSSRVATANRQSHRAEALKAGSSRQRGTILVPTDFTAAAEKALGHAKILAKRLGLRVVMLHVIQPSYAEGFLSPHQKKDLRASARRGIKKKLNSIARAHSSAEVPVTSLIRVGLAEYEILRTAQDLQVQMMVLGRQNRNPLSRIVFGSVTGDIIDAATCPVLVVNAVKSVTNRSRPQIARAEALEKLEHLSI